MEEPIDDIEALEALTTQAEVEAVEVVLRRLENDTDILLFVRPGCAVCPHQLRSVATVTLASERIGLEIVDATEEPELAARYDVRAVPTTVVDDELVIVGVVPAQELAWRLVERQGPEAERLIFTGLVASGRHADAAERLADGRGAASFLALWGDGGTEARSALLEVAEQAHLLDPGSLSPLLPDLLAGLEDGGPLSRDDDRRADTADLLGRIGDPGARATLERLARDPDPDVAEAAEDALATLDAEAARDA